MGDSGKDHRDLIDAKAGFTAAQHNDDIPIGYEHGRFHLLTLGAFIVSYPLRTTLMNGRQKHGGTAPMAPPGVVPVPWAIRLNTIGYPQDHMLTGGDTLIALAVLPNGKLFKAAPEMMGMW